MLSPMVRLSRYWLILPAGSSRRGAIQQLVHSAGSTPAHSSSAWSAHAPHHSHPNLLNASARHPQNATLDAEMQHPRAHLHRGSAGAGPGSKSSPPAQSSQAGRRWRRGCRRASPARRPLCRGRQVGRTEAAGGSECGWLEGQAWQRWSDRTQLTVMGGQPCGQAARQPPCSQLTWRRGRRACPPAARSGAAATAAQSGSAAHCGSAPPSRPG